MLLAKLEPEGWVYTATASLRIAGLIHANACIAFKVYPPNYLFGKYSLCAREIKHIPSSSFLGALNFGLMLAERRCGSVKNEGENILWNEFLSIVPCLSMTMYTLSIFISY